MKLKNVQITNFRCFESMAIDFDEQLTVFVAENGGGKTAILDAIAIALSPFVGGFDTGVGKGFKYEDARLDRDASSYSEDAFLLASLAILPRVLNMESQYPISLSASGIIGGKYEQWSRELTGKKTQTTFGKAKVLIDYAKTLQQQVRTREAVTLPIIAYYGTGRLWKQNQTNSKSSTESQSRLYGYHDALNPNSNYKSFEKWFIEESIAEYYNESKMRSELHNSAKKIEEEMFKKHGIKIPLSGSPISASYNPADRPFHASKIKHVQKAINECLSVAGWSSLEYEPNRRELIITNANKNFIPVAQLSDGVKAMLSLTADIAYRCVQLNSHLIHPNPNFSSPIEETNGIVLIDEIDLHLHPKWQQTVLSDLCKVFPKIQFIVTTHSPQVLSTVPSHQIRVLDNGKVCSVSAGTQGAEASRILQEIFGVELRSQHLDIVKKLNAYLKFIDDDKWDSEEALTLRQELNEWSQGNEPELFKADINIRMKEFQRQL